MMANAALVGCTGLVGSNILSTLLASPAIARVDTISRRHPAAADPSPPVKLTTVVDEDTDRWATRITALSPPPSILFSALGTTSGAAGGVENQYKLDHDVNLELARAARNTGTRIYVLISSAGANKSSRFSYMKMKGELEEDAKALDFEHTIILQPGAIAGKREKSRPIEAALTFVAGIVGKVHSALKDPWTQDADIIAKAAVNAALKAADGEIPDKVWTLGGSDILKLGRA